jgi:hypothetical protein
MTPEPPQLGAPEFICGPSPLLFDCVHRAACPSEDLPQLPAEAFNIVQARRAAGAETPPAGSE